MKLDRIPYIIATTLICMVWFVNGLFFKILDLAPRHQQIVAQILGTDYAWFFTKAIGVAEILMVVWIVTRIKSRVCAIAQMIIVGTMNIIEFIVVPDLLLFGRVNIIVASIFIALIYVNEFVLGKPKAYAVIK